MECNKIDNGLINFNKFNESINEYNEETKGEFNNFLTTCITKGGASRDTKLNKYFFIILRCLIFSVFTEHILKELIIGLPALLIHQISIGFIKLLKILIINGCLVQIPIMNDMCPMYKDLFIEFLNNLEIILIKLGPVLDYGIDKLIDLSSIRDIYNDSKIFYYLLNNPEFIDDIEYPVGTVFIVNKNNYPVDFVQKINSAINGDEQQITTLFGNGPQDATDIKYIPQGIQKMTFLTRRQVFAEDVFITSKRQEIYLHPVYTRFYINIGYLTVEYISEDEAKNELTKYLKGREETGKILHLLELKYNIPESSMRSIAASLGESYKTSLIKSNTKPTSTFTSTFKKGGAKSRFTKGRRTGRRKGGAKSRFTKGRRTGRRKGGAKSRFTKGRKNG